MPRRTSSPHRSPTLRRFLGAGLAAWVAANTALAAGLPTAEDARLPQRAPLVTSTVIGSPDPPPPFRAVKTHPKLTFQQPLHVIPEPGTDRRLVTERFGKIKILTRDAEQSQADVFLDVGREAYSLCFHPRYAENRYVYVFTNGKLPLAKDHPAWKDPEKASSVEKPDKDGKVVQNRISRYVVSREAPFLADPKSETTILEWPSNGHNGHYLLFGPDGLLWISAGDGTTGMDPELDAQNVANLRGTMLRIDVDHPTADRPYSIPQDNPFVGHPVAQPEIWAFGFRNPYRFAFDPRLPGQVWVADIGQDAWEMIYLATPGGNYGWSVMEGPGPLNLTRPRGPGPIVPPVVSHPHSEMRSITGGFFYRGDRFPELRGAYLYGDYDTRRLQLMRYDPRRKAVTEQKEIARTTYRIISVDEDRDREILMVGFGGEMLALERTPESVRQNHDFPKTLSATGLFASVPEYRFVPGVFPYSVNSPLWSDGAHKERALAVPAMARIGYRAKRAWEFPQRSVLVKSFSFDVPGATAKDAPRRRRIETRLLTLEDNGEWAGYSYRWNDAQTDAVLVGRAGEDVGYRVVDPQAPGGTRLLSWRFPSRAECMVCHTREARYVLGATTLQMNRDHDYGQGVIENQIRALDRLGWFDAPLEIAPEELDRLPDPHDPTWPLEARVLSYLHANCWHCHVENGGGNAQMILEFGRTREATAIVDAKPRHMDFGLPDARLVAPGSPERSVIVQRLSRRGAHQMPPVATRVVDESAVRLVREWAKSMPAP